MGVELQLAALVALTVHQLPREALVEGEELGGGSHAAKRTPHRESLKIEHRNNNE